MDPCTFVRVLIGNLAVKFPVSSSSPASVPAPARIHPSSTETCYCKVKLSNFPHQIAAVPVFQPEISSDPESRNPNPSGLFSSPAACFGLSKGEIEKSVKKSKHSLLSVEVFSCGEGDGGASCGIAAGRKKLLGRFEVAVDLKAGETRACLVQNGWVALGESNKGMKKAGARPELHLSVRIEPDPRFVFQFDGEPECSPQVYQVQGSTKQAVFTCKFGVRNSAGDRNPMSSLSMAEPSTSRSFLSSFNSDKEQPSRERKGWSITVHDLSGSPVAMASMVTPFVPSHGSNRVTRSSPGAWLILRPADCTWKPWGRLEAWRESGFSDSLGYRFEQFHDATGPANISTTSSINLKRGGKFAIDNITTNTNNAASPVLMSPQGSWDFGSGFGSTSGSGSRPGSRPGSGSGSDFATLLPSLLPNRGFVTSATVGGVRKGTGPEVEVGVNHVTCTEDAAAYVALAAAVDLSMDACTLFSQRLRKELRQQSQVGVV